MPGSIIADIIAMGQDMLDHPINLLPHVEETVSSLSSSFHLVLITKGDLLHQEQKLARSGLGDLFDAVEIVSDKTPETYTEAFTRHGHGADRALMVGNSVKSDVIPAIEAGGWGVHVPARYEWEVEKAELPSDHPRFRGIGHLGELPTLVDDLLR